MILEVFSNLNDSICPFNATSLPFGMLPVPQRHITAAAIPTSRCCAPLQERITVASRSSQNLGRSANHCGLPRRLRLCSASTRSQLGSMEERKDGAQPQPLPNSRVDPEEKVSPPEFFLTHLCQEGVNACF